MFTSLYIYHFSTVIDFSSEKYKGSTVVQYRSTVVLPDTGTPGTSGEIYSEDADGETRSCNPWITNPVL